MWTYCERADISESINKGFPAGSVLKNLPANAGDPGSIPGSRKSPEEGNGNWLKYSCLENPVDREKHSGLQSMGSQERQTRLSD